MKQNRIARNQVPPVGIKMLKITPNVSSREFTLCLVSEKVNWMRHTRHCVHYITIIGSTALREPWPSSEASAS
jgi:hypothetical protein